MMATCFKRPRQTSPQRCLAAKGRHAVLGHLNLSKNRSAFWEVSRYPLVNSHHYGQWKNGLLCRTSMEIYG